MLSITGGSVRDRRLTNSGYAIIIRGEVSFVEVNPTISFLVCAWPRCDSIPLAVYSVLDVVQWVTHTLKLNGLCKMNQGSEHRRLANSVARNCGFVKDNLISFCRQPGLGTGDALKNLEHIITSLATLEKLDHEF